MSRYLKKSTRPGEVRQLVSDKGFDLPGPSSKEGTSTFLNIPSSPAAETRVWRATCV